ncbi:MAG: hypothetical protein GDA41_03495 [Rhodospirillales bacterium]|nr:hypothetical protein [Rhodospirillales bacterium]
MTLFTNSLAIYPVVEDHPKHGLLVGVSSGGKFRIPVGNVLWRVDKNDSILVSSADMPTVEQTHVDEYYKKLDQNINNKNNYSEILSKATADLMKQTSSGLISALAGAAVASGEKAHKMLNQMRSGQSLIIRRNLGTHSDIGIPQSSDLLVGQFFNGQQRPIPIDRSFHTALEACNIS